MIRTREKFLRAIVILIWMRIRINLFLKGNYIEHTIFSLLIVFWEICISKGLKEGLTVNNTDCPYRVQVFNSQHLHGGSQFSVTTVAEESDTIFWSAQTLCTHDA